MHGGHTEKQTESLQAACPQAEASTVPCKRMIYNSLFTEIAGGLSLRYDGDTMALVVNLTQKAWFACGGTC